MTYSDFSASNFLASASSCFASSKASSKSTEFNVINRGGKGVKVAKVTKKTGKIVAVKSITGNEDLMIMTDQGIIIRIDISTISTLGRTATGVKVINLVDDQKVATVTLAEKEENYEDD